ncbi:CDP-alcohol phosphatidyltransferase [candidate division KSB3 bacterium]|nr:MAG: CDP-alcohol phosphatidyltransferase [candidate division KSB3 bacterium]
MNKDIIGKTLGKLGSRGRDACARFLIEKGFSPNILTLAGVVINVLGAVLLALGVRDVTGINWMHITAGAVILLANIFDTLDGAVARMSGQETRFGAFLDSVTDRYSDMCLFSGALVYFAVKGDVLFVIVSSLAAMGGIMTSYVRARAESLLPGKFNAGYMERPERIIVFAIACLFDRLYFGMLCIAVFANLATFHRGWDVWCMNRNLEDPEHARQGYGSIKAPRHLRALRSVFFWTHSRQTWQHDALGIFLFVLLLISPHR